MLIFGVSSQHSSSTATLHESLLWRRDAVSSLWRRRLHFSKMSANLREGACGGSWSSPRSRPGCLATSEPLQVQAPTNVTSSQSHAGLRPPHACLVLMYFASMAEFNS